MKTMGNHLIVPLELAAEIADSPEAPGREPEKRSWRNLHQEDPPRV
jgi:hypothetical protein